METAQAILDRHNGTGPGFNWCRLMLSICVIGSHAHDIAYGHDYLPSSAWAYENIARPIFAMVLPMFFGLSGFLVTGSALRVRDTQVFLTFRGLRIVPALAVETVLSAIILGLLFTRLPLTKYFTDFHFWGYFGNIVGRIRFFLPGVFEDLPYTGVVNANLWTLHPELGCYAIMALLMITRVAYSKLLLTIVWLVAGALLIYLDLRTATNHTIAVYGGTTLIFCFITGSVAFHWRDLLLINWKFFALSLAAGYLLIRLPYTGAAVSILMVYAIIWLGLRQYRSSRLVDNVDCSYGIYLYSFPLMQMIVAVSPAAREWWIVFAAGAIVSIAVASLSWHFVERPALRLKRFLIKAMPSAPAQMTEASLVPR